MNFKENNDLPKSAERINSPYDEEAKYGKKRAMKWIGYKVHITESCMPKKPCVITNVKTTMATVNDSVVVDEIHGALREIGISPKKHYVDKGYISGHNIEQSQRKHKIELVGPAKVETGWQTKIEGGITRSDLRVDWAEGVVICPMNSKAKIGKPDFVKGKLRYQARFSKLHCNDCILRAKCTKSNKTGRVVTLMSEEATKYLEKRRKEQKAESFALDYATRAGVEGVFFVMCNHMNMRKCRYKGQKKAALQHSLTATAVNVKRSVRFFQGFPLATKQKVRFMEASA